jgi:hypothetical protein
MDDDDKLKVFPKSRGKGKLLPEHMRELPSELVTDDEANEDAVHELDPPHIVEALKGEHAKKILEEERPQTTKEQLELLIGLESAPTGIGGPLNQRRVDIVRMRIIRAVLDSLVEFGPSGDRYKHVWFPNDEINVYELREGNAPADSVRPKHLKRLDLSIDILRPPQWILDILGLDMVQILETIDLEAKWKRNGLGGQIIH